MGTWVGRQGHPPLLLAFLVAILVSCRAGGPPQDPGYGSKSAAAKLRVAAENRDKEWFSSVFTGLSLEEGQILAEKLGYRPLRQSGDFMEQVGTGPGTLHTNVHYLYLDREFPRAWVSRRVQVALVLVENRIGGVYFSEGLTGP